MTCVEILETQETGVVPLITQRCRLMTYGGTSGAHHSATCPQLLRSTEIATPLSPPVGGIGRGRQRPGTRPGLWTNLSTFRSPNLLRGADGVHRLHARVLSSASRAWLLGSGIRCNGPTVVGMDLWPSQRKTSKIGTLWGCYE